MFDLRGALGDAPAVIAPRPSPWEVALAEVFGPRDADPGGEAPLPPPPVTPLIAPPLSLYDFVRGAWHVVEPGTSFAPNWHVEAICLHLEAVTRSLALVRVQEATPDERGVIPDIDPWWTQPAIRHLIINIPPGHMKSLLTAVFWPAWVWTFRPEWRAIFASYDDDLVIRDSVRCRTVIASDWYQETFSPDWQLAGDQNVKGYFRNTRMGERKSVTVGGGATGFRGDAVVVDDPLNVIHRFSDERRKKASDWWNTAMSSRLNDKRCGARVIMMQRLHAGDLAGEMLKKGLYDHLCLPTEFEPKRAAKTSIGWRDPRTEEGELLFPGMFPREVVEEIKGELGSDGFAAQHQQRPSAAAGGIFKRPWWRFYRVVPPKCHELVQSWDMSFKDLDDNDFVVGQVWGRVAADLFLLDQVRARLDFPNTLRAVRALSAKWPRATAKFVEDKANGPAVIAMLKHEIPGLIAVPPEGGKIVRAHAAAPVVEAGNVYLPDVEVALERAREWARVAAERGSWLASRYVTTRRTTNDDLGIELAEWVHDFIEEHAAMTPSGGTGENDDQVDGTTQAIIRVFKRPLTGRPPAARTASSAAGAIAAME